MTSALYVRPNILVVAYACEPGKGGEQGVGWNWVLQISRFADVTVITRANNREAIEGELSQLSGPVPKFEFYDPPAWALRLKRASLGLYLFYFIWQWGCRNVAKRLDREQSFTHVQQLTFGNIWLPVAVRGLKGQFIWGPIGGGEGVPIHLLGEVSAKARYLQRLRLFLIATLRFNPIVAPVLKRADLLLIRTEDTMRILPSSARSKAISMQESGISAETLERLSPPEERSTGSAPTILFTGRLVGFKNVEMLLHAAARARENGVDFRLRIVGDGPERSRLIALTKQLQLEERTTFVGTVPYAQHLEELRNAHIFAFPSLREAGPWSPMEAMCAALPVICVDTSGMSMITSEDCAIRVAPTSREAIISGFAQAINDLCSSTELRTQLGQRARARMRDKFIWERKGDEIAERVLRIAPRSCD